MTSLFQTYQKESEKVSLIFITLAHFEIFQFYKINQWKHLYPPLPDLC